MEISKTSLLASDFSVIFSSNGLVIVSDGASLRNSVTSILCSFAAIKIASLRAPGIASRFFQPCIVVTATLIFEDIGLIPPNFSIIAAAFSIGCFFVLLMIKYLFSYTHTY